jgi:LPXTG-site transpeptidase (sortase) family protein
MKMNRIKALWSHWYLRFLLILSVAAILIGLAASGAVMTATSAPRTIAEAPTETEITFDMEANHAYTASDGVVVIPASVTPTEEAPAAVDTPAPAFHVSDDAIAESVTPVKIGGNYTLPEDVMMPDGSVGVLSIPKLSLSVNVYETADEMEAMTHGLAHFKTTSAWSGNIGLCGHNVNFDLTDGYFKHIHTLQAGDIINYTTALGSRTYAVETVAEITETDWSYLGRTEDDRVTLITCISGKPRSRLVVQAVAI